MQFNGFIILTELCSHHHYLILEHLYYHQKKLHTPKTDSPFPLPSSWLLIYFLYEYAYFRHFRQMELYNIQSFVTALFHLIKIKQFFQGSLCCNMHRYFIPFCCRSAHFFCLLVLHILSELHHVMLHVSRWPLLLFAFFT